MFPTLFTTLWDTTCIRIQEPRNWAVARYTCNGHYDFPCYLVLLGITFTGMLVFYSGLHRSTAYDSHIFQDTGHLHPQHHFEMNIGDVHFRNCSNFATLPVKPTGGHHSPADLVFMQYLQLVRSRIETLNTVFKRHRRRENEHRVAVPSQLFFYWSRGLLRHTSPQLPRRTDSSRHPRGSRLAVLPGGKLTARLRELFHRQRRDQDFGRATED